MKKLLLVLIVAIAMVSCTSGYSSEAGRRTTAIKEMKNLPDSILFRAKMLVVEEKTGVFLELIDMKMVKIPFGYTTGDTVYTNGFYYRLLNAVAK